MTLRDALTNRKRKAGIAAYSGFAIFAAAMALGGAERSWFLVGIAGFVLFCVSVIYLLFFLRCPACRGRIGYTVGYSGGPFSVSPKIRHCPYCGISLDAKVQKHAV
jgi:hypothetical protein